VLDFLIRRVAISIVTLFVISLIVFTGVRMIPGAPARVMGGTDADAARHAEIRQ
jgi:ABC-type dipeptide/oligopeptide/nickel transport system permease component